MRKTLGRPDSFFFGGGGGFGPKYVWVHGLELAACRSSGDQNYVVALRFLENLCTLGLGDSEGSSSLPSDRRVYGKTRWFF